MASIFTVSMTDQTVKPDSTLVFLRSAADVTARGSIIQITRLTIGQIGTTESEQIGIVIGEKLGPFGRYVPATPAPHNLAAPLSGVVGGSDGGAGTAGVAAVDEGAGSVITTIADTFNNVSGYSWTASHEERIWIAVDTALVVKFVGTPKSLSGWFASLTYEEIT